MSGDKKAKSALTAALSGAPAAAAGPPNPSSAAVGGLGSLDAFPCLLCAPDDGSPLPDALADGISSIDLSKVQIVGSLPTRTSLPNGTQLVRS